jgi:hypothetical protein
MQLTADEPRLPRQKTVHIGTDPLEGFGLIVCRCLEGDDDDELSFAHV